MTRTQLKAKIDQLEYWLSHNPDHPDRSTVIKDLWDTKDQLKKYKQEKKRYES